ncbi:MAG TPA: hypothetical protein VMV29_19135 [Ktedonobacterales bacterium]|nr:hypothetical protein [Ktedonobacterales bacterium]
MYIYILDPDHGWLEVPEQDVVDAGVADRISRYSYRDYEHHLWYLEEDCDMPLFLAAAGLTEQDFTEAYHGADCFVRRLPHVGATA